MTEAPDDMLNSLLSDFLDESGQLIDRLNENLLKLDEEVRLLDEGDPADCDDELLNEMFRSAHSLKGLSAMLGLKDINDLTHKLENVLDAARLRELTITHQAVDLMFQSADRLAGLIERLRDVDAPEIDCGDVMEAIASLLQSAGVERQQTTQAEAERALADIGASEATPPAPPVVAAPAATAVAAVQPEVDYLAGIEDDRSSPTKYVSIFIDETETALDSLTETLLNLENGGNHEQATEQLMMTSHRIKGSAACVGFHRPARLAHFMEDVVQRLRDDRSPLQPEVADALLKCTDGLRKYIVGLKVGGGVATDEYNGLIRDLLAAQAKSPRTAPPQQPVAQDTAAQQTVARQPVARAAATSPMATANEPAAPGFPPTAAGPTAAGPTAAGPTAAGLSADRLETIAAAAAGRAALAGKITFVPGLPLVGLKARLAYEKLGHVGEVFFFDPPAEGIEDVEVLDSLAFGLCTHCEEAEVRRALNIAGVRQVDLSPIGTAAPPARPPAAPKSETAAPPPASAPASAIAASPPAAPAARKASGPSDPEATRSEGKPTETLRVDIERLDQLMNLAGQLVINKARFNLICDGLKSVGGSKQARQAVGNLTSLLHRVAESTTGESSGAAGPTNFETIRAHVRKMASELETIRRAVEELGVVRGAVNDLSEAVHQLDRVSDGIQKSVMDTRMVPIGPLFGRFRRVIRDITRANGKEIQLVIRGEKTELDKRMIDELGDPLIHLIRNAADHGIEPPEVRTAQGKPAQGSVTLDAFHRGNSIVIQITDDGKGLDHQRIRAKAVEKGILSPADAERLTPQQAYQLVWEPGFSTAEKVTEISGRGMGMDIVKSKIEDINGTVELDSTPGQGARFEIRLPLTLAILPSLLAKIDGDVFALPVESIVEIVSVPPSDLARVHGLPTATVRGRVVSVVQLSEVFTWRVGAKQPAEKADSVTLVVLGSEGQELGLAVNELLGEEDVVIKSIAENYKNVVGIAGASILGDGRVALILDTAALVEMASRQGASYEYPGKS